MNTRANVRDICIAIRDYCEGRDFSHFCGGVSGELEEVPQAWQFSFIDVGNAVAGGAVILLDNGQIFRLTITPMAGE